MVVGRLIAGFGGSGMTDLISMIVIDIAAPGQTATTRSYVNVAAITGRGLGGVLGGTVSELVGWRW